MDIPYNIITESKSYKKATYLFERAINSWNRTKWLQKQKNTHVVMNNFWNFSGAPYNMNCNSKVILKSNSEICSF